MYDAENVEFKFSPLRRHLNDNYPSFTDNGFTEESATHNHKRILLLVFRIWLARTTDNLEIKAR